MLKNIKLNKPIVFASIIFLMLLTACGKCPKSSDPKTLLPTFVSKSKATLNGKDLKYNPEIDEYFEYGTTTAYGNEVKVSTPEFGGNPFNADISGLSPATTYHYRLIIAGSCGVTYGPDVSFTTLKDGESEIIFNPDLSYGTASDVDGNIYKTIQIGTQVWMAENLKVTRFNNGTPVQMESSDDNWINLTSPGYCWAMNDSSYKTSIGAYYNWYAVNSGKLCPSGWHVPSSVEWDTLMMSRPNTIYKLGLLEEKGHSHWLFPPRDVTNSTGFTALGSGYRYLRMNESTSEPYNYVHWRGLGITGNWWSSSEISSVNSYSVKISNQDSDCCAYYSNHTAGKTGESKRCGLSVRCIKD